MLIFYLLLESKLQVSFIALIKIKCRMALHQHHEIINTISVGDFWIEKFLVTHNNTSYGYK